MVLLKLVVVTEVDYTVVDVDASAVIKDEGVVETGAFEVVDIEEVEGEEAISAD